MTRCFLCRVKLPHNYKIMAYVEKGEHRRKKGTPKFVHCQICKGCAKSDPSVHHFKVKGVDESDIM